MAGVKNSIRVAVCDDCKSDRDFLRENLKTYKAENPALFEIEEFESGEALLANGAEQYDLIFLDIYMGQMTGMDTAGELRRRGKKSCRRQQEVRGLIEESKQVFLYYYCSGSCRFGNSSRNRDSNCKTS